MKDKSLEYRMLRLLMWLWAGLFVVSMIMANLAYSERDEALRFRAQYGDVSLSCRVLDGGGQSAIKSTETRADQGAEGGAQ